MNSFNKKSLDVLARVSRRRFFWPLAAVLFVIYMALPLMDEQGSIQTAESSAAFSTAVESLRNETSKVSEYSDGKQRTFIFYISPFAQVSIPIRAAWENSEKPFVRVNQGTAVVSLRFDQIVLAGSLLVMLALTISTLYPKSEATAAVAQEVTSKTSQPQSNAHALLNHANAKQVFAHEVRHAELRTETLFRRSTYLLTGGVLMAFIGVAVFYATVPDPLKDEAHSSYLIRVIRSTGMLVFLEAIAWFLLRQYRSLIEDFKGFHRIYMKRANYLAAITLLDKENIRGEDILIVSALLGEDFSGKLVTGETTESLENMKQEGGNPVFEMVRDALSKAFVRSAGDEKSK